MIESGFNPLAVSRMGAKGMWQFMAATARRYGLRVDQWIDERLDPEKSTVAAAAYLRDLHTMFGSWTLAQAAYNAGEVKVSKAIRATGSNDFWALAKTNYLKPETKDFVPAIQAATLIAKDPGRYGFDFPEAGARTRSTRSPCRRRPSSATCRPGGHRARDAARAQSGAGAGRDPARATRVAGPGPGRHGAPTSWPRWRRRRPASARRRATAPSRGRSTRRAATRVTTCTSSVPRTRCRSIAKQYGVAVKDVLRWNRLEEQARIRPGDRIRVADCPPVRRS